MTIAARGPGPCEHGRQAARSKRDRPERAGGAVASVDHRLGQGGLMRRRHGEVPTPGSSFAGFRFPPDVITLAVRWYLRYALSYRDVEELLIERGIEVDHVKPCSYGTR